MSRKRSSTKPAPPEPVFFVDADLSDAHFHAILSAAGVRFERHDDHFAQGADDLEWLVKAGENDWVVLSHNKSLRYVSAQTERLFESSVRVFMLMGKARPNPAGHRSIFTRELAENFVNTLPAVQRFLRRHPRTWIAKLYRPSDLSPGAPGEIKMWLTLQAWLKGR
ncbi:MAG TPA: hypothetical protein DD490_15415 [Acidobacteria bacterium]|nr:hypothetical protein [Acidobacteriota bacterium]